jgi:hypothetical protein
MQPSDDMPFREYMNGDINPLIPGGKADREMIVDPEKYPFGDHMTPETNELLRPPEIDPLLDWRHNELIPRPEGLVDTQPCKADCERRAFMADLRQLGADPDEIADIMRGYQNDPGCHECNG